jgi:AraC-like DNA-binding protein
MAMDVLSDVLRVVRLSGAVFFTADFSSPWAVESPPPDALATLVLPDAECVVLFHVLIDGECVVACESHPAVRMEAGDVIVFPHGHPHRMGSRDGLKATPILEVFTPGPRGALPLPQVCLGGGGRASRLVCGYLNCDQRFGPLIGALPTMLLVRSRDDYAGIEANDAGGRRSTDVPTGTGTWLGTTIKFTVNEARSSRPGNTALLGRLTELMFVEILREYMQQLPEGQGGWLAGLNDPHVGRALALLHASPTRNWTVEELSREAAISRSALAERFTQLVGESPMRYLTNWRMQLARQLLREGTHSMQEVATRVGYESEAAFNRAFKRATGSPPATWRRGVASL